MSLRGRLLVVIVLMNLMVLGGIHATALLLRERWLEQETQHHLEILQRERGYLLPAGTSVMQENSELILDPVMRILEQDSFRHKFRDILITNNGKHVDVSPLGSAHRDHATFPIQAIRAGIARAMRDERLVSVAGGRCVAIKSETGRIEGGAWFVPALPSEPRLPFVAYALPVLLSIIVFSVLASWLVGRTLGPPMAQLGTAARRVEAGDYSTRVPDMESAPELNPLVDAFNAMATKVEGHTGELEREVQLATEEAAAKERAMLVSARLASVGTLAAGVAHEINNPLGGMLNAVHRLSQGEGFSAKQRQYLALIQQGLERVAQTSRKLLDFTPRVLEPVRFHLTDAVEAAHGLVEHQISRQGVRFTMDVSRDLPALMGEPHEIQQVLLNLFLNSLNAIGDTPERSITVRAAVVGERIELTVEDDGPGVDSKTLNAVMDPFFSGSKLPSATGLGLFICYTIIRHHDGEMRVESELGEGFRVFLALPIR